MIDLSVIIPSRTEDYLQKTIDDILSKAKGNVEVVVVLDGYWPKEYNWTDSRIKVIHQGKPGMGKGMRAGINAGMAIAKGTYLMKTDEHCMFDEGFDQKLIADSSDNWVVIPRRYRLDADNWQIIKDGRPPIDYMYLENKDGYLHGNEWKQRAEERKDILIDDTMTFQGSCWFLKKDFFWDVIGPMDDQAYGSFANEAQEIGNKAWLSGGRVVVNKKTWYAHWHRDSRGYGFTHQEQRAYNEGIKQGREFAADYWLNNKWKERVHDFSWLVEKFSPLPKETL